MMTFIRNARIVFVVLLFIGWIVAAYVALRTSNKKTVVTNWTYEVIDSVWYLSPGELNSLQTDYLYYAKTTSGFKFKTTRLMSVGDSMYFPKK